MKAKLHTFGPVAPNNDGLTEWVQVLSIDGERALVLTSVGRTQYCHLDQLNFKRRKRRNR